MKKRILILIPFCIVIGFLLVTQVRNTDGQKLYVSARVIDEYKLSIESEKQSIAQIEERIAETEKKLQEYQTLSQEDNKDEILKQMQEKLDEYKLVSHATEVKGQGVSILIDDGTRELMEGENVNDVLVHDNDLLMVLNDLYAAGAEAVSVNGHRITGQTSISCSGYTVRINGRFEARPFRIKAVGDANRMASALLGPGCYGVLLRDYGLIFELTVQDDIEIPGFSEDRTYQYMTITKEGETN